MTGISDAVGVIVLLRIASAGEPQGKQVAMPITNPRVAPTHTPPTAMLPRLRPACTGSMEPTITCLDLMVEQPVFKPADIQIGSIIRVASCGRRFTHRVVALSETGGQRYYQTKGDANPQPDNCWIPHHDVYGLIVGLERNAVPENAALRDGVNAARAAMRANPSDPVAIATYHCWRRAALTASPGDIPHEC